MNLSEISTKDLLNELSKREAVQRIEVSAEQNVEICVQQEKLPRYPFDQVFDGPQIILRIWD